jgi:hypothetical protein
MDSLKADEDFTLKEVQMLRWSKKMENITVLGSRMIQEVLLS